MSAYAWTDRRVREALGLSLKRADPEVAYAGVSTDSRTVGPDALFVALVGDRFDGHDFVADAAAGGATGAVISRPVAGAERLRIYPVDDTLVALGRLARHRRRALDAPVVGVTGSSGKTTTKELMKGALERTYRTHVTERNLNNRIGLPLTLLDAPDEAEVVVVEMGTNEPGEIETLTEIAEPGYGVVTTVSESHLEGLGSLEGVLEEKLALLRGLVGEPGTAIVSDEPPALARAAREARSDVRVAGWSDVADDDLRPEEPEADSRGRFHFRWRGHDVALRIPGRHAVLDALLALAVADELGVDPGSAAKGVGTVEPAPMRGEIRSVGSLTLLLDCYNANPESVAAALDLLGTYPELGRRVAVLGTMLELGSRSAELHRRVLADALDRPLDLIVAIGGFAEAARQAGEAGETGETGEARDRIPPERPQPERPEQAGPEPERSEPEPSESERPEPEPSGPAADDDGPRLIAVDGVEEAYAALLPELTGGEVVLLKASRGVELERLVPLLEWDFEGGGGEEEAVEGGGSPSEGGDGGGAGSGTEASDDGRAVGRSSMVDPSAGGEG